MCLMPNQPRPNDPRQSSDPAVQAVETLAAQGVSATGTPPQPGGGSSASALAVPATESPVTKPEALVGQCFDDLELLEYLGRGGMGVVYKAKQRSLDRVAALKLLLAQHFLEPMRLARFQAEARAAASLNHTNIVQIYQVGQCSLGHYFVMEYVDGPSLETLIQKGTLSISQAVAILIRIAKAVHYAHSRGIIHRDLKPSNIMFDGSNRPVVMDFGIAKFIGRSSSLTQQGAVMGTPAFMAPEQAGEGGGTVGPHSDVYALGALLYTMLSGRVPFDEGTPIRTVLKVIGPDMPPELRSLRPEVPAKLEGICMRCMSKHPADRYASALALAEDLTRLRASLSSLGGKAAMARRQPALLLESLADGKTLRVSRQKTVIGRTSDCDIVVRAADVSKQHCRILVDAEEIVVEDLDSSNGTFVNDRPVKRFPLVDGDRLRIGDYEFVVRLGKPKD
jgi:serine/threonine protein kinase